MNSNELTITITGETAQQYLTLRDDYLTLLNKYDATAEELSTLKDNLSSLDDPITTDVDNPTPSLTDVIEVNPVNFPQVKPARKANGSWSSEDLSTLAHALESGHTFSFLKLALAPRTPNAIRTMLSRNGISVKNNILIAKD